MWWSVRLSTGALTALDAEVELDGRDPRAVARNGPREQGAAQGGRGPATPGRSPASGGPGAAWPSGAPPRRRPAGIAEHHGLARVAAILVSTAFLALKPTGSGLAIDASTWLLRQLAAVGTPGLTGPANWISTTRSTWHRRSGWPAWWLGIVSAPPYLLVFTPAPVVLELAAGDDPTPVPAMAIRCAGHRPWDGHHVPPRSLLSADALPRRRLPRGRARPGQAVAKAVMAAVVAVFGLSWSTLAVDHLVRPLLAIPVHTAVVFEPRAIWSAASGGPRAWRCGARGRAPGPDRCVGAGHG